MKFQPSCRYEEFEQKAFGGGTAVAWISSESEDICWDKFLQETPYGQFQQSTIWARAKQPGGWKPVRVVVTTDGEIVGGFQILRRPYWWGGIGYLSKGPVVLAPAPEIADFATELLRKLSRRERLRALVVQPPDLCEQMPTRLAGGGFEPDVLGEVNSATWIVGLEGGFEAVEQRMDGEARRKARQAVKRGVSIREGGRQDLETFFELMLSTCKRQQVDPNPPDVQHLFALWDAAYPAGCIRLYFADYEGKPLTGYIDIGFGKTLTQWKKGWTSTEGQRNPNDLGTYEALKWASGNGYRSYDFSAFDKKIAMALLNGEPLSAEQERTRHTFFIRFGGAPRLLPESRVYFPNPLLRLAYRVYFRNKIRQAEEEGKSTSGLSTVCDGPKLAGAGKPI